MLIIGHFPNFSKSLSRQNYRKSLSIFLAFRETLESGQPAFYTVPFDQKQLYRSGKSSFPISCNRVLAKTSSLSGADSLTGRHWIRERISWIKLISNEHNTNKIYHLKYPLEIHRQKRFDLFVHVPQDKAESKQSLYRWNRSKGSARSRGVPSILCRENRTKRLLGRRPKLQRAYLAFLFSDFCANCLVFSWQIHN